MDINTTICIITFVTDSWDTLPMSRHYIAEGLSKHFFVIWVEPALHWRKAVRLLAKKGPKRGIRKIKGRFWVYSPGRLLFRTYSMRRLNRILEYIRNVRLKLFVKALNARRVVLYIWRPEFVYNVGRFREDMICYHIDDEYTFADVDTPVTQMEKTLIELSEMVFIHSKTLIEKKGRINPNTFYIPNGVDYKKYRTIIRTCHHELNDLAEIERPRIGYIGYLKKELDLELLLNIARQRAEWSIVVIGPVKRLTHGHETMIENLRLLKKQSNVYFLGSKRPDEVPLYINAMDVCLLCYKKTPYTNYIYPLKLHEYMACGKPVISTKLDNLREYRDIIYFAETLEEWIHQIECALREDDDIKKAKRLQVASSNSWENRVNTIREKIYDGLQKHTR